MSDFEKNDEIKRKYSEVLDSIADDINQINYNESANPEDIGVTDLASDDFIQSISDVDFDNPDEVLNSVNASDDTGAAPLFDDMVFRNEFGADESDLNNHLSSMTLSDELTDDIPDTLTCDECRDLLYDYVSELTDEVESKAINVHLRNCEMCRVELDDIRDMIGVMSSSQLPVPPFNLMDGMHEKLLSVAPEVKAEYQSLRADSSVLDKAKNVLNYAKDKTDYFVRHANWKVLAPAALSAVLVVGVASSGLYQVMKSSDEIYNFSDDAAIAGAKATAKPSASGLDDYVNGNSKTSSTPKSSASPKNSGSSSSNSAVLPKVTPKPSTSSSSSSGLPGIGSSNSGSSSSSSSSKTSSSSSSGTSSKSSSSSSANRSSTSSTSSSSKTTSSTSSTNKVSSPAPTSKPYVTPNIILPDIGSVMSSNSSSGVVIPDNPAPDTFDIGSYDASSDSSNAGRTSDNPSDTPGGGGGGNANVAPAMTSSGGEAANSAAEAPKPTQKPVPTAVPTKAPAAAKATENPAATPVATHNVNLDRNEKGETALFTEKASEMQDASVVSCSVSSNEVYDELMNSSMAECSKIESNGDVILYFTDSEFVEFTKFLKENDLDYTLMVLGKNEDVKVILHGPETK